MSRSDLYLRYHGLLVPKTAHTEESLSYFESFQFQDSDVIAITYPKSGTTWMQEILPLLLNEGDLTPVLTVPNWDRAPWIEEIRAALVMDKMKAPRCFVSHMLPHLMPSTFFSSKAKIIYVMRNPKDVMVSSFYFHQMASFLHDPGTLEEFAESFLAGDVMFGKWSDHVKSWRNTDLGNRILYITYEEMVQDLYGALERIVHFLGVHLSQDALKRVAEQCEFKTMKGNTMSNFSLVPDTMMNKKSPFLRKGIAGDWKNHFGPELEAKFNAVISKEMKGAGIEFPWDKEQ